MLGGEQELEKGLDNLVAEYGGGVMDMDMEDAQARPSTSKAARTSKSGVKKRRCRGEHAS